MMPEQGTLTITSDGLNVSLNGGTGVYPAQMLQAAIAEGTIASDVYTIPPRNVQPASVDLRLGEKAYRLRCSFLPENEDVATKLSHYKMGELDLRDGAVFERNRPYLVPLIEELHLPADIRAKASPKSSIGRLDIFTRVITDRGHQFDEIPAGYNGRLYLEVVSRTFTIEVRTGLPLNQLRLIRGNPTCHDADIPHLHAESPLLLSDGAPVPDAALTLGRGLFLSVALDHSTTPVGYRAKKNSKLLNLSLTRYYESGDFWEPVYPERGGRVVLEPEEFYLLMSREGVRVPPNFSAEMTAYDPSSGELRTHYAGFFDPGFGYTPGGREGSRAVLEVRAHDVPFMIEHGQRVCKLVFERMMARPSRLYGDAIGSSYQQQQDVLSKHFVATGRRSTAKQLRLPSSGMAGTTEDPASDSHSPTLAFPTGA